MSLNEAELRMWLNGGDLALHVWGSGFKCPYGKPEQENSVQKSSIQEGGEVDSLSLLHRGYFEGIIFLIVYFCQATLSSLKLIRFPFIDEVILMRNSTNDFPQLCSPSLWLRNHFTHLFSFFLFLFPLTQIMRNLKPKNESLTHTLKFLHYTWSPDFFLNIT